MKKTGLVILFFLLTFQQVFAADIIWRITHNDQDALIVGEIVNEIGGSFKVDVKHVVSGKMPNNTINISNDFLYWGTEIKPIVGDFLVLSLDKKLLNYEIKWGAYKATSGDFESLQLDKVDLSTGIQADFTVLERYINSNGKDNDFSYKDEKVYLKKEKGEDVLIFTPDDAVFKNIKNEIVSFNVINNLEDIKQPLVKQYKYDSIIVAGVLIVGLMAISILKRK